MILFIPIILVSQSWKGVVTTEVALNNLERFEIGVISTGIQVATQMTKAGSPNFRFYHSITADGEIINYQNFNLNSNVYTNIAVNENRGFICSGGGRYFRTLYTVDQGSNWSSNNFDLGSEFKMDGLDLAIRPEDDSPVVSYAKKSSNEQYIVAGNITPTGSSGSWKTITNSYNTDFQPYPSICLNDNDSIYVGFLDGNVFKVYSHHNDYQNYWVISTSAEYGKVLVDNSRLYVYYRDSGNELRVHIKPLGSNSWSSSIIENDINNDVMPQLVQTNNGNLYAFYKKSDLDCKVSTNNGVSWSNKDFNTGTITDLSAAADFNDVYVIFKESNSNYFKMNQLDAAPATPQNFSISGSVGQHPQLSWSANKDLDLAGYKVYRSVDSYPFVSIATLSPSITSYIDNDVTILHPKDAVSDVCYKLIAYDSNSNNSNYTENECVLSNLTQKTSAQKTTIAENYILKNSFPNPFNPTTNISFNISEKSVVSLRIYNLLGELISTLVDRVMDAGSYTELFNATDIPSGVYVSTLSATSLESENRFTQSRKMILLK